MNIIAVDDEYLQLIDLEFAIKEAIPEASVITFTSSTAAAKFGSENHIDIAYLDINMPVLNGIELAKQLRETNPLINIVFVTGYDRYAKESYSVQASGYLTKPINAEAVVDSLKHLRSPVEAATKAKLRIKCFGNFDVYTDDGILYFPRQKSKETFAYLIHKRGTSCTTKEICAIIYDEGEYVASVDKQIQTVISDMRRALREVGAEDVILKSRNCLSVDMTKVDCDYYRFLEKDPETVRLYMGEYMTNYAWAEFKTEYLDGVLEK